VHYNIPIFGITDSRENIVVWRMSALPPKADIHVQPPTYIGTLLKGWALNRQRVRHFFHRSYNTAVGQLASHDRRLAMPLERGEVQGYNFNRMAVEFTMVNQGKVVPCSISTAAMEDLEGRRDVKSDQRIDQFMRLREIIEERASRKFFEEQAQADRPVVLRSNDFSS
jgi:hypothetical protein